MFVPPRDNVPMINQPEDPLRSADSFGSKFILLALIVIFILGAFLRFYDLGTENYWFDEIIMVYIAQADTQTILTDTVETGRPPAYVLLAHVWTGIFGTSEVATRSLSAVLGILSIGVMYLVGRELFGRPVGLLSALMIAIAEFQIQFSQEYRYYSLVVLMALLSYLFFVRMFRTRKQRYVVLYVIATAILFYAHTLTIFVIAGQNLFFLLLWRRHKNQRLLWFLSQLAVFITVMPGIWFAATGKIVIGGGVGDWLIAPSFTLPFSAVAKYILPARYDRSWTEVAVVFAVGLLFFLAATALFALKKGPSRWVTAVKNLLPSIQTMLTNKSSEIVMVVCWLLCPILLLIGLSLLIGPSYLHKYTIGASPAIYLLAALAIVVVHKAFPIVASLGLFIIVVIPGLYAYYVTDIKEQWQETAAYIESNEQEGDVIILAPNDERWQERNFLWYYRGELTTCGVDKALIDSAQIAAAFETCTQRAVRVWLVERDELEPFQDFLFNQEHDMSLIEQQEFRGITLYLFADEPL